MTETKFQVPTEEIELPSKGLVYPKDNQLSSGKIEMKYMTAKEEDIITNPNNLKNGTAIEKLLKALIVTPINYDDMTLGDRNGLLIAARILSYGKDYQFKWTNPETGEDEVVTADLQTLKYKTVDEKLYKNTNEFEFTLPKSGNRITFKILTVADDKAMDDEIKGLKKALNQDAGLMSMRLKYQITSVNGDYNKKTVREFIDSGAMIAMDALAFRKYAASITPDIDMIATITTKLGEEVEVDMPMTAQFFFPDIQL